MKGYYSNTAKDNSEFYVGSAIYQTDTTVGNPTLSQLKYMKTDEGCFSQQKDGYFAHEYMIKDHLGNTRVLFGDYNGNDSIEASEVLQQAHYYPFGMAFTGVDLDADTNKFLYNGKELQTDGGLGWYDYGARFYDASLGRWNVIDPLVEIDFSVSPYAYVVNNPLRFTDPDGQNKNDRMRRRARRKMEKFMENNPNSTVTLTESVEDGAYVGQVTMKDDNNKGEATVVSSKLYRGKRAKRKKKQLTTDHTGIMIYGKGGGPLSVAPVTTGDIWFSLDFNEFMEIMDPILQVVKTKSENEIGTDSYDARKKIVEVAGDNLNTKTTDAQIKGENSNDNTNAQGRVRVLFKKENVYWRDSTSEDGSTVWRMRNNDTIGKWIKGDMQ